MPFDYWEHHLEPVCLLFKFEIPIYDTVSSESEFLLFWASVNPKLPLNHINLILIKFYLLFLILPDKISLKQLDISNLVDFCRQLDILLDVVNRPSFDPGVLSKSQNSFPGFYWLFFWLIWVLNLLWYFWFRIIRFIWRIPRIRVDRVTCNLDIHSILLLRGPFLRIQTRCKLALGVDVVYRDVILNHFVAKEIHLALSIIYEFLLSERGLICHLDLLFVLRLI